MPTNLPLRDIHLPEAVGFFPMAMGWWYLLLGLLGLFWFMVSSIKRYRRHSAIRIAKRELFAIQMGKLSPQQQLCAISILLRRVAVSYYPLGQVASLSSNEWLDFLRQALPKNTFLDHHAHLLNLAPYSQYAPSQQEIDLLIDFCHLWIAAQKR